MLVDRFFVWVTEASVEQRRRAVDVLVRAYFSGRTGEEEREALEAALTLIAEDADIEVRRALAEALADADEAPRHVLLGLIWDHPSVAEPIVTRSDCLIDAELVDLAAGAEGRIQLAVARRRRVGPTVATALSEAADRPAVVALLANANADIPAAALGRLVDRFGEFADVREALMTRPHVPITVRHRVLEKLAEAMGNLVVVRDWIRGERAETVTRDAREKATVALAAGAGTGETEVLVEHLRRSGQLTTRLLLRAACVGNLPFVEESLSCLAGVPSTRVAALVADGRESAFRALYRRARMPERAFPAFAAAIEIHRGLVHESGGLDGRAGDHARFARRLVERVLTRYTGFDRRDGDDLLALLRRFAADAARDHARAVMVERTAQAEHALSLPRTRVPENVEPAEAVSECGRLDVVPTSSVGPRGVEMPVVATPPVAPSTAVEARPIDDMDRPVGLFSHVRLEDIPTEWLVDEQASVSPWSEGAVTLRTSLMPDGAAAPGDEAPMQELDEAVLSALESDIGAELIGGLRGSVETDRAA